MSTRKADFDLIGFYDGPPFTELNSLTPYLSDRGKEMLFTRLSEGELRKMAKWWKRVRKSVGGV